MRQAVIGISAALALVASPATAHDHAGWNARIDAVLLNPSISGQGFGRIFNRVPADVEFDGQLENDLDAGVRVVLGKENCCGFGVRFTYFDFENDPDNENYRGEWDGASLIPVAGVVDVGVQAFDAEVTQRACFNCWDIVVGGGLRYGEVDISQPGNLFVGIGDFYGIRSGVKFEGVGPTLSVAAERQIGCSGFSLVGRARTAMLFGEIDQMRTFGPGPVPVYGDESDDYLQVTELQFGVNYSRCIRGATGTFGVFWEAQRWDSESGALGDLALHGLSLQTGLTY